MSQDQRKIKIKEKVLYFIIAYWSQLHFLDEVSSFLHRKSGSHKIAIQMLIIWGGKALNE